MVAAINCYFMSQGGAMFRAQVECSPYLYLQIKVSRDQACHVKSCLTCCCLAGIESEEILLRSWVSSIDPLITHLDGTQHVPESGTIH